MAAMAPYNPGEDYDRYRGDWEGSKATSPNTLRGQIRRFLQNTGMKVGVFHKLISIAAAPYGRFMNGKYKDQWSAAQNQTYRGASYFFFREKKLGKNSVAKMLQSAAAPKPSAPDVSAVALDDENVYLTPAEVRKGLSDVQKDYACNNGQLAHLLGAPNANAVSRFMSSGGEFGGQDQDMYRYGATFLERLRLHLGKPKSKKRQGERELAQTYRTLRITRGLTVRPCAPLMRVHLYNMMYRAAIEDEASQRDNKRPFLGVDASQKFWVPQGSSLCKRKDELGRTVVVPSGGMW